jgi:hypothetical protein
MCNLDSEANLPSPESTEDFWLEYITLIKNSHSDYITLLKKIHEDEIRLKEKEIECYVNLLRKYKSATQLEILTIRNEYENKLLEQDKKYELTVRRIERRAKIINFYQYQGVTMTNQNINAGRDINAPIASSLRMDDNIVVNNSIVENALNKVRSEYNEGVNIADALKAVEEEINKSGNTEAAENFESFNEELSKPEPKKSILKTLWQGTLAALPSLSQFTSIISNVEKLFS